MAKETETGSAIYDRRIVKWIRPDSHGINLVKSSIVNYNSVRPMHILSAEVGDVLQAVAGVAAKLDALLRLAFASAVLEPPILEALNKTLLREAVADG